MGNWQWNPLAYGPRIGELLSDHRLSPLDAGEPNLRAKPILERLTAEQAFATPRDRNMAGCCLAGLWLLHDFLDESHRLSQEIETTSGSYWHGLMHRREGDFGNSKYWFRRVGEHPIFPTLATEVQRLAIDAEQRDVQNALAIQDRWDPCAFVDMCERAVRGSTDKRFCESVQQLEWRILFDHCYRSAVGNAQ
jgi:hypothetical protein